MSDEQQSPTYQIVQPEELVALISTLQEQREWQWAREMARSVFGSSARTITFDYTKDYTDKDEPYYFVSNVSAKDEQGRTLPYDLSSSFWDSFMIEYRHKQQSLRAAFASWCERNADEPWYINIGNENARFEDFIDGNYDYDLYSKFALPGSDCGDERTFDLSVSPVEQAKVPTFYRAV